MIFKFLSVMTRSSSKELNLALLAKDAEIAYLSEQIALLRKALFAAKSERHPLIEKDPIEIDLFETSVESTTFPQAEATEEVLYTRKKRGADQNRMALPEHLDRRVEIVELPEDERQCLECGSTLREIGEDVTEELEIIPMQIYVRRIVRKKYACPSDSLHGVFRARMPARAIPKGIAGAGLLAHILVSKYVDHLPLDRQEKIFLRLGIKIPKTTMSDWMGRVRHLLDPLIQRLKERMLDSRIVNCDETTMLVQNNARGGPKRNGYLWSYIGDSRWTWFEWREGRGAVGPLETLRGFTGEYLQSDGYNVYVGVADAIKVDHLGCWAHARRKFVEALATGYDKAGGVIELIAKLYEVETDAKEYSATDRKSIRAKRSIPLLGQLHALLGELTQNAVPKGALGKAISYTLGQWARLVKYCNDGELSIDNNIVERAIRPVALGRKNWLFAGSEDGAQWAAGFYSLIETAKLCGVDPGKYLTEVIGVIADYEDGNDLDQLLPEAYAWRINGGNNLPPLALEKSKK